MSVCKRCGANIQWKRMVKTGKMMPVDAEPVRIIPKDGRSIFVSDNGEIVVGRKARPEEITGDTETAYVPHWSTCPYADSFRKKQ